jgi:UDPglucose 6-dehydrogenase
VHFIAVGAPQRKGENAADLTYVDAAIDDLIPHLSDGDLVVGKSTVPVRTAARLAPKVTVASIASSMGCRTARRGNEPRRS